MDGQTFAKANIPNGTNALKEENQGGLPGNESEKVEKLGAGEDSKLSIRKAKSTRA